MREFKIVQVLEIPKEGHQVVVELREFRRVKEVKTLVDLDTGETIASNEVGAGDAVEGAFRETLVFSNGEVCDVAAIKARCEVLGIRARLEALLANHIVTEEPIDKTPENRKLD